MRLPPKALVGIPLLSILVLLVSSPACAQQLTHTCKFDKGPRAGQMIAFTTVPPIPVGAPCRDGVASTGVTVPDNLHPQFTHTCKFDQGPRAGQTQVFQQSLPVGASCWDGVSSGGVTIADGTSAPEPSKPPPQNPAAVSPPEQKQPQATQPPILKQDSSRLPSNSNPIRQPPQTTIAPEPPNPSAQNPASVAPQEQKPTRQPTPLQDASQPRPNSDFILDKLYLGDFRNIDTTNDQAKIDLVAVMAVFADMNLANVCESYAEVRKELGVDAADVLRVTHWLVRSDRGGEVIISAPKTYGMPGYDTYWRVLSRFGDESERWRRDHGGSRPDLWECNVEFLKTTYKNFFKLVMGRSGTSPGNGTKFVPSLSGGWFRTRAPSAQDLKAGGPSQQKPLEDELQRAAAQGPLLRPCTYGGGEEAAREYAYWYPAVPDMSSDLRSALPSVLSAVLATCPAKEDSFVVLIKIMTPKPNSSVTARIRAFAKDDIHLPPDPKYNMFGYRPDASELYFGKLLDGLVNSGQQVLECADSSSRGRPQLFWYRTLPLVNNQVDPDFIDYATKWAANVAPGALRVCPPANPAEARYYLRLR